MRPVGVMSQGLRAAQCAAYFSEQPDGQNALILTSNVAVFESMKLPPQVSVTPMSPEQSPVPSTKAAASNLRSRIILWARSGSRFGRGVERVARQFVRVWRRADELLFIKRLRRNHTDAGAASRPAVLSALQRVHHVEPITLLVVFDLYDLPTVMEFGAQSGIPVVVR